MATNSTFTEESIKDLSECCICMELYDELQRTPKSISCSHTFCLPCIKRMASAGRFNCPKCKRNCDLPFKDAAKLPTNMSTLMIIQLKKLNYCLDCGGIPKMTCVGAHTIIDTAEDVKKIKILLAKVLYSRSKTAEKRHQIEEHLQTIVHSNSESLQKLRSLTKQRPLDASKVGVTSAIKTLEEALKYAEEEEVEAGKLYAGTESLQLMDRTVDSTGPTAKKRKMESAAAADRFYNFPSDQALSARRLASSKPLYITTLGGGQPVNAIEFSDDGSFFVSGGNNNSVLLWSTSNAINCKDIQPQNTKMDTKHECIIVSLAMTPDNERIFSGSKDKKVLIHDATTANLLSTFQHPDEINHITLQPKTNGNLFATVCGDSKFRLFDIRQSTTDPIFQSPKKPESLTNAMFSPADSTVLAMANSQDGAFFYDIRHPKSCLHSFPSPMGTSIVRFNSSGTRLLCYENEPQLVVYDLPTSTTTATTGKIHLMDPNFSNRHVWCDTCCFAGISDEIVISASDNHSLVFWSLPDDATGQGVDVDMSLKTLMGHNDYICSVRYSIESSVIASCDDGGIIKLWTSGASQY